MHKTVEITNAREFAREFAIGFTGEIAGENFGKTGVLKDALGLGLLLLLVASTQMASFVFGA